MTSITVNAPAKLNLTLDVLGKRADDYHEVKMVMQSVALADELTLTLGPGEGLTLSTNLGFLPVNGKNLAVAAALCLQRECGIAWEHLNIDLKKKIPVCAGTAGGSADAAAVLRGLNELLQLNLSPERLAQIGEEVGSDVPYCVLGGTALAEGRGERVTTLPAIPFCWVVMAKPDFPVSTPELFARLDGQRLRCHPDTTGLVTALREQDLHGVARRLFNVFEEILPQRKREQVEELKQTLLDNGALGACMTGTGPTVFGLFESGEIAQQAYEAVKRLPVEAFLTYTIPSNT